MPAEVITFRLQAVASIISIGMAQTDGYEPQGLKAIQVSRR